MTSEPEDHDREHGVDEDAVWADIVAHYGDRAELSDPPPPLVKPPPVSGPDQLRYQDSLNTTPEGWEDEGHFVPPEPPPLPRLDPRRKLAWIGLFGPPALLLAAVVFGWTLPQWLGGLMVVGFLGGFIYLVATMPRGPRDSHDGWDGDDGAVL